jgi:ATP-dependent Clp protease, protease subunit
LNLIKSELCDDCGEDHDEEEPSRGQVLSNGKKMYIFGEINPDITGSFIVNFKNADSSKEGGPIIIHVCSSGGWVEGGLCMYDMIKSAQNQVITVGCGAVYSAAVLPFEAGDVRLMYKSARLLLHDMSMNLGEIKLNAIKNVAKETGRVYDLSLAYLAKRTGLKYKELHDLCQNDTFLNASECVKYGLVDKIIQDNSHKLGELNLKAFKKK